MDGLYLYGTLERNALIVVVLIPRTDMRMDWGADTECARLSYQQRRNGVECSWES